MLQILGFIFALIPSIYSAQVTGRIVLGRNPTQEVLQDITKTTVSLNQGAHIAYITKDLAFSFNNIPDGQYILSVNSRLTEFHNYMIQIHGKTSQFSQYNATSGETREFQTEDLEVRFSTPKQIFVPTVPFDPTTLLKSPMVIMVGVTALLFICMKNMPDMEEMQKMQNEVGTGK